MPRELTLQSHPAYVVEPPDILRIQATDAITGASRFLQPLRGEFLVRQDGTVNMGIYGQIYVSGATLAMVKDLVADRLFERLPERLKKRYTDDAGQVREAVTKEGVKSELDIDVIGYNSKYYYVIFDGAGYGQQVYRLSITGKDTVLDAISQVGGLPPVASKRHIWVARPAPATKGSYQILPVNWEVLTQAADTATNYQMFPGDRIFVHSDPLIRTDSFLAKLFSPIERTFGVVLLGSTTVNSIRQR
jgi:polysaccharide export outer membrane protein